MSLFDLENVLMKPAQPCEISDSANWGTVEQRLGTKLPTDYREFIQSFGSGTIDGFLTVFNPFSSNKYINLIERGRSELEAYATSKQKFPQHYPFDVFPVSGGVLPLGATDNGEVIYWKTEGAPENWGVIAYEARGPKCFEFAGDMTSFIAALLTKILRCEVFPRDFPTSHPKFTPLEVRQA